MRSDSEASSLTAEDLRPLLERLDVIIGLLGRVQPIKERARLTDRIRLLSQLGLENVAIARIVGRESNYIAAVLGPKTPRRQKGVRRARKAEARR